MHGTKPAALENPGNKLSRSIKIGTGEKKKDLQLRVVGRRHSVTGVCALRELIA
jgi:hypothetical protein